MLQEKVALVTAASRGLGRACAEAMARQGAAIAICGRNEETITETAREIAEATGSTVVGYTADVADAGSVSSLVEAVLGRFGRIDALVNNAGGPPGGSLFELTDDRWALAFELTLMSVVRLTRAVVPAMKQQGSGSIVSIVSSSVRQPIPNLLLSNTFRPAIVGFAKSMAIELAPSGVRVNNVAPGRIATERVHQLDLMNAQRKSVDVSEIKAASVARIPMGRYGQPREFGEVVAFLASDSASYVTGQTLMVDGGMVHSLL